MGTNVDAELIVPRLRRGAGASVESALCAAQVLDWLEGGLGDPYPHSVDRSLATCIHRLNDGICVESQGGFLCPPCSSLVLGTGFRVVGTELGARGLRRRVVWLPADQPRSPSRAFTGSPPGHRHHALARPPPPPGTRPNA